MLALVLLGLSALAIRLRGLTRQSVLSIWAIRRLENRDGFGSIPRIVGAWAALLKSHFSIAQRSDLVGMRIWRLGPEIQP